jgi:hypothetical protein
MPHDTADQIVCNVSEKACSPAFINNLVNNSDLNGRVPIRVRRSM